MPNDEEIVKSLLIWQLIKVWVDLNGGLWSELTRELFVKLKGIVLKDLVGEDKKIVEIDLAITIQISSGIKVGETEVVGKDKEVGEIDEGVCIEIGDELDRDGEGGKGGPSPTIIDRESQSGTADRPGLDQERIAVEGDGGDGGVGAGGRLAEPVAIVVGE